jgi:hypothetical protein
MSTGAVATMLVGMAAIWGGLALSILVVLRRTRASRGR